MQRAQHRIQPNHKPVYKEQPLVLLLFYLIKLHNFFFFLLRLLKVIGFLLWKALTPERGLIFSPP